MRKRIFAKMFLICLCTSLLTGSNPLPSMGAIEVLPKGTVLQEDKICLDADDAKDVVIAYEIEKARNEAKDQIIKQYEEIIARKDENILAQDNVINEWKRLAEEMTQENEARIKKEKTVSFTNGLLWGLLGGGIVAVIASD